MKLETTKIEFEEKRLDEINISLVKNYVYNYESIINECGIKDHFGNIELIHLEDKELIRCRIGTKIAFIKRILPDLQLAVVTYNQKENKYVLEKLQNIKIKVTE